MSRNNNEFDGTIDNGTMPPVAVATFNAIKHAFVNLTEVVCKSYEVAKETPEAPADSACSQLSLKEDGDVFTMKLPSEMTFIGEHNGKLIFVENTKLAEILEKGTTLKRKVYLLTALLVGEENIRKYTLCPGRLKDLSSASSFPSAFITGITNIVNNQKSNKNVDERDIKAQLKRIFNEKRQ